ncbi:60S ribosomal protein L5-1 [Triticum aestivum]|uniref:60S ribosomal protein L5-1 n=1 Tax=Aegilops tauschii TaxID=37682 RepID=M8BQR9_AEGTA|nr:60S ribosomal protein L5-1-like [Triticum aestivum]
MGVDTCSLCTMMTPCISCAPQPSPSRHRRSRSKDAEVVQSQGRVGRSVREGFTYPFYTDKSLLFRIAMGALDGGLDIAHSDKRLLASRRIRSSWASIADEESKKYQSHFSEYIKKNIAADDMEALYKKVHATIRAYPTMAKSTKEPPKTHKS